MVKVFYMVALDSGGPPVARHETLEKAQNEAARLAVKHGTNAHVLEVIATCTPVANVTWALR